MSDILTKRRSTKHLDILLFLTYTKTYANFSLDILTLKRSYSFPIVSVTESSFKPISKHVTVATKGESHISSGKKVAEERIVQFGRLYLRFLGCCVVVVFYCSRNRDKQVYYCSLQGYCNSVSGEDDPNPASLAGNICYDWGIFAMIVVVTQLSLWIT